VDRLDARRGPGIGLGLDVMAEEGEFDLIVAPNDRFAGILNDSARAVAKTRRLLARDGLLLIEGLYVPPQEDAVAPAPDGLIRERSSTTDWSSARCGARLGEHQDDVTNGAVTRVRAWQFGETALRESDARISGGLDERAFDPWGDRLIAVGLGWS
jgi:hypothetical protein